MSWEVIGGICAIIGVVYSIYQFHYLPGKELEEAKLNLLAQYLTSQKLLDQLLADLKSYAHTNNGHHSMFGQGATFGSYIAYLENMRSTELSQDTYNKLVRNNYPKEVITTMTNNLAKQITSFNVSQAYFDTTFKYITVG